MVKNKGLDFKEAVVPDIGVEKKHVKFDMKQVDESHKLISIIRSFQSWAQSTVWSLIKPSKQ